MDKHTADEYLKQVIALSKEMIELASAGDACRPKAWRRSHSTHRESDWPRACQAWSLDNHASRSS